MDELSRSRGSGNATTLDLGVEGVAWVRSSLLSGLALAKTFLGLNVLESGTAMTFVRPGISRAEALRALQHGGVSSLDASNNALWCALVEERVASGTLVVEDDLGERGDPYLDRVENEILFVQREVYHLFPFPWGAEDLGTCLRSGSGYPLNAFVLSDSASIVAGAADPSELNAIARSVVRVVVMAYDAEGYVVWKPS